MCLRYGVALEDCFYDVRRKLTRRIEADEQKTRAGTGIISCNSKVRASYADGGQRTVRREKRGMPYKDIKQTLFL